MYFDEYKEQLEFSISDYEISCDCGVLQYSLEEGGAIINSISVYRKR